VFIAGLLFAASGMYCLLYPNAALSILGQHFEGANSLGQERGTAGGVSLTCGVFLIASVHYPRLTLPALWLVTLVLGGLEAGRLVSLVADGAPGTVVWIYIALEILGLVQGLFYLRRQLAVLA
jgi:hypothetical protein